MQTLPVFFFSSIRTVPFAAQSGTSVPELQIFSPAALFLSRNVGRILHVSVLSFAYLFTGSSCVLTEEMESYMSPLNPCPSNSIRIKWATRMRGGRMLETVKVWERLDIRAETVNTGRIKPLFLSEQLSNRNFRGLKPQTYPFHLVPWMALDEKLKDHHLQFIPTVT